MAEYEAGHIAACHHPRNVDDRKPAAAGSRK
jgi:hypothetical protein